MLRALVLTASRNRQRASESCQHGLAPTVLQNGSGSRASQTFEELAALQRCCSCQLMPSSFSFLLSNPPTHKWVLLPPHSWGNVALRDALILVSPSWVEKLEPASKFTETLGSFGWQTRHRTDGDVTFIHFTYDACEPPTWKQIHAWR